MMESVSDLIGVILLIGAVVAALNIILFFKIWGMTNDTEKIKNILQEWLDIEHPLVEDEKSKNGQRQKLP